MNEPSLIERPRVLVLFRNPLDRKLVVRFLEERDIDADVVGDSDQMESLLEGSFSDFSLVILDLDVALAFGPRLLSKGDEIERPLPILLALPADASAPHWLAKGYHDVVRMPVRKQEIQARINSNLVRMSKTEKQLDEMNKRLLRQNESLRVARARAKKADLVKSRFLANMSHELRTPLNGIKMATENIRHLTETESIQEQLDIIDVSSETLLKLVGSILDLARMDHKKFNIEISTFQLQPRLEALLQPLRARAQEKGITFDFHLSPEVPKFIESDPVRLDQILGNLLTNALKFTSRGTVSLEILREEQTLLFRVRDTGRGIPEEQIGSIFERFFQIDDKDSRELDGAGIGLAIVQQIVDSLGGKISVQSTVGNGSTFTVELPLQETVEPTSETQDSSAPQGAEESFRLLVVEDNPINIRVLKTLLSGWGHEVTTATSGAQAVELFGESFDLIVMDVQMPGMTGHEATRKLRTLEKKHRWKRTPVLALTAAASEEDKKQCLAAGMDDYLSKPPNSKVLRETIGKLARGEKSGSSTPNGA